METESFAFNSKNDMARESLNFDGPGPTVNGETVNGNSQKAESSMTSSANVSPKLKYQTSILYDPMVHTTNRPPYSFSSLIFLAIEDSAEKALPVKEIYAWIVQHFPYFKTAPTDWKNTVRRKLSTDKSFIRVKKALNMLGGSSWRVDPHQRPNFVQTLERSQFYQFTDFYKLSPYKTNPRVTPVCTRESSIRRSEVSSTVCTSDINNSAVMESEDYHRVPVETKSIASNGNNDNEDVLMTRESLNFDSLEAAANNESLSSNRQKSPSSTGASPKQKLLTNVPYDPMVHITCKPPYSYSSLIFLAIEDSPQKALLVKEIYAWLVQHFPYFKTAPTDWKNTVRRKLSTDKSFIRVQKAANMLEGSSWRVEQKLRPNLLQALARSHFQQLSAVEKFGPYNTLPPMSDNPPPTPDPEESPKLWDILKDGSNNGVNRSSTESLNEPDKHRQRLFVFKRV